VSAGAGLDSSAAMVRAESDHLDATLNALVRRLSAVPGLKTVVQYRRGRLARLVGDLPYLNGLHSPRAPIEKVVVTLGPHSYWLESERDAIRCGRELTSTGAEPLREELQFSAWATALFEQVAQQNLVNHESMVALRQLVEQDQLD
jgi:hypothetical protein